MKDDLLKNNSRKLTQGQMGRREFIVSAMAAGLTLPSALSLVKKAEAATPKKGGKLILGYGYGSTTDSLDPGTSENGMTQGIHKAYGNLLFDTENTGELKGDLVESHEGSNGAKTWALNLRRGVEFHNGKTLDADDVITTLNYHRGESSKSAAKGLLSGISDIRKGSKTQVIFELSSGNGDFPYLLSDYHLVIMPAKGGNVDPLAGMGTGPYVLQSFEPGVKGTFVKNANYWRSDRGHFDEVEILTILDTTARQNAVMNGEVHAVNEVDPKFVSLMKRNPGIDILQTTGTKHYTFPMRLDTKPFDNYDLRMALKLSIKRQELVDKILLGFGALGNDIPVNGAMPFHNDTIAQREYDVDRAAFHYKKSGHSGTIPLNVSDAAFPGAVDAAQLIAASAKDAGINIEVIREPKDGYWSNVWNKKGWCACYWGGRPTPDWMFKAAYTKDTEWNDTAWRGTKASKRFNELVVAAASETDQAVRRTKYFEAQELLHDDGGVILPMFANYIMAYTKKLAHEPNVAANWEMDGNRLAERWWFA